jgi:hypothetical protein
MAKTTNIAGIIAQQPDTWVDGSFNALVTSAKAPYQGKGSAKCILVDPQDHASKIEASFWNVDPIRYEGMVVSFYGAIKRTQYKDRPQVSLGEKAKLTIVSSAGGAPAPAGVAGVHMPVATLTTTTASNPSAPINVQEELGKIAALALLCMEKAQLVKSMNGSFSAQFYENLAMNMNIDAQRKNLQNHLPAMQVKPTDLKQVVVPVQSEEDPF